MIDFRLDEEYEDLRNTVRDFARSEVAPVIGEFYEREEFPYEIVARMGEIIVRPRSEDYGGMGGDYFALCLALEELARVDCRWRSPWRPGCRSGDADYRFGTEEQKRSGFRAVRGRALGVR